MNIRGYFLFFFEKLMFTQTTNAQSINSMSITMVFPHIDTFEFGLQITISVAHSLKAKWMHFNKLPASFCKM